MGEQASTPYSYSFFQGGLFDITFTAKVYRSNDLATVSQAKADYATLKDQIAQRLGRVENVAESFDPKNRSSPVSMMIIAAPMESASSMLTREPSFS